MLRDYLRLKLMLVTALLVMPVVVSAICLTPDQATDPNDKGYATAVQADQGNGSIDCTAFIGPGGPMHQVPIVQDKTLGTVAPYDPIHWSLPAGTDASDNVDVLYIGNSDGSRCNQYYKGNALAGFAAAGSKLNKPSDLVACADGYSEPQPQEAPVPPVSTSSDTCDDIKDPESKKLQDAINENGKYDVVIGIGRGKKGDNTAVCTDTSVGDQNRCVDRCITPDPVNNPVPVLADPHTDLDCEGDGPTFPLKCRVCELSTVVDSDPYTNGSPQFCWEQLQKVNLTEGTFKKAPGPKSSQVWKVDEYAGSTCYKVSGTTDSGYQYSYWVPSGCPK